jgi:hypothetical protein
VRYHCISGQKKVTPLNCSKKLEETPPNYSEKLEETPPNCSEKLEETPLNCSGEVRRNSSELFKKLEETPLNCSKKLEETFSISNGFQHQVLMIFSSKNMSFLSILRWRGRLMRISLRLKR